ncbi:MAG: SpoIVB peptidase S55 domain-containing protein [Phycisphaerae bacterium]
MNKVVFGILAVLMAWLAAAGQATMAAADSFESLGTPPPGCMYENQLRPGMVGYGLTVMHGADIQKFHVKIIDVVKDFGPDMNVIIVRCWGLGLRHSGIIEGMSGSPVYMDGKLIGAIAYGWHYSKNPIGGVQPIRQMLHIPLPNANKKMAWQGGSGGLTWMEKAAITHHLLGWSAMVRHLYGIGAAVEGTTLQTSVNTAIKLQPLASPLMVGGGSGSVMRYLQDAFANTGIVPLAAGAAGNGGKGQLGGLAMTPPAAMDLRPGAAIAVPLLNGDMDMSAIGTVTDVVNGHVYAFGHRFFAQGRSELPIAGAYIYTIIPDVEASFKLGAGFTRQGRLVMDQATGIVGELGKPAPAAAVTMTIAYHNPSWQKTFHYHLFLDPRTSMQALGAALVGTMTAKRKVVAKTGNYTIHITGTIHFAGADLPVDDYYTTGYFSPNHALMPVALLMNNPFQDLKLKRVNLHISAQGVNHAAVITSAVVRRKTVPPGGTVRVRLTVKPFRGPDHYVYLHIKVPANTPDGSYNLAVGSANSAIAQEMTYFPQRFAPNSAGALIADIKHLMAYRDNNIYARLVLNMHGVDQQRNAMPNLPLSRVAIMAKNPPANLYPLFNSVQVRVPAGGIVEQGGQQFTIKVRRHANQRFVKLTPVPEFPAPPGMPGPPP